MIHVNDEFWDDHVPDMMKVDGTRSSCEDIEVLLRNEFDTKVRVWVDVDYFVYCVEFDDPRHDLMFQIKYSQYVLKNPSDHSSRVRMLC